MTYTGNVPPTPIPNPCHSLEGIGEPGYNPCNYWPYLSEPWQAYNAIGAAYDDWIRGRQQDMAKTFVPTIVRNLKRACAYIQKHHDTLTANLTTTQMACLDSIVQSVNTCFGTTVDREAP